MNNFIKKNTSTILTGVGIVGVFLTGFLVHKDTKRAVKRLGTEELSKKEEFKETWTCYIPSVLVTAATVGCVVAGKCLDAKQIATLIGSAGASGRLLYEYKDAIRERYGKEGLDDITRDVAKKHEDGVPVAGCYNIITDWFGGLCEFEDQLDGPEKCDELFYDEFADQWFYSTKNNVRAAFYYLNHNHSQRLYSTYGDLYAFLGVELPMDLAVREWGDKYIEETECTWIETELVPSHKEDGTEYNIIRFGYNPDYPEEE